MRKFGHIDTRDTHHPRSTKARSKRIPREEGDWGKYIRNQEGDVVRIFREEPRSESTRVNVKSILADPGLRRRLMVSTIQATQAREGIDTTEEQANRAYYVVQEAK